MLVPAKYCIAYTACTGNRGNFLCWNGESWVLTITESSIGEKVPVAIVATDRHPGIRELMKDKYPQIGHEFDIWHLSKELKKILLEKSKQKGCSNLALWIRAVCNHLWWCAANCRGDALLLKEMWTSITHHISNQHSWDNADEYKQHSHLPIPEERDEERVWLEAGSPAHEVLQEIVLSKLPLKKLKQAVHCCHTGHLEMYHSTMLKYCPKRLNFPHAGMRTRTQLAVLNHNNNLYRKQAITSHLKKGSLEKGDDQFKLVFQRDQESRLQNQYMNRSHTVM
ncbi:hypothetical protein HOLleu_25262 [Holothuria leucospilota]|uniref:Uncharacterized protein n=1 Tax=Holothuria leucospilota TaxID=206669 RepID=A0A9Q1H3V8_HOLLE|nr:hypothetical protein HOLleu_25262 [Holothuria leucospilota]